MRRKHCEITDPKEIERILSSTNLGRLATIGADGYPYITPVNFVWHGAKIYFHSAPAGEKLDNLARNAKVCFEVDIPLAYLDAGYDPERRTCRVHQLYHCVIVRGKARMLPNGPLKVAALNALVAKHEGGSDFEPVNQDMPAYKGCAVVEIEPSLISAKSDLFQNRTDEERLAIAKYLKARNLPTDLATVRAMGFDPDAT
ncbi:MAG TPA: pyridoxamine 5'-phosphate oxidase family protein [Desulfomonilaceae bacterium]|nr:pyridoxamine 5'-phosphate oxidase family protein [Desulfomonilaceae bacterium]